METYFGYICPRCGSTVQIGIGRPACPSCGAQMAPNKKASPSAANVYCKSCSSAFGVVTSDRCPKCGGPLSRLPDQ